MADTCFSFESLEYGTPESYYGMSGELHKGGTVKLLGAEEDWGDFDMLCSSEDNIVDEQKGGFLSSDEELQQQSPLHSSYNSCFGVPDDDFLFNVTPPSSIQAPENSDPLESVLIELSEPTTPKFIQKPCHFTTLSSLDLLRAYKGCRYNQMNGKKLNEQNLVIQPCAAVDDYERLSTEEVMRVAGAQYINFAIPKDNYNLTMLSNPFGCAFSGLMEEETKDVELARLLLASAEKIGNRQFRRGSKLLTQCANLSSYTGNPVQRIAYYFSEALQERIDRETGRVRSKGANGRWRHVSDADVEETVLSPNPAVLDCFKLLPFIQMAVFTSIQAIVESLSSAKKAHLIDFGLRTGIPWTLLMQGLAARKESPIEVLKITAVGTKNRQEILDACKLLTSFAENMGFRFSFNIIMVSNIEDIKEELFDIEKDESIAVYTPFVLRTMLTLSDRLDSLMKVIRNLNPCIMVVTEVEGNHNSPLFFNRFIECLFYFSAFFDCLDTCMDRNSENRMKTEALYFGEAILNIVATEGEERTFRNVGIDVWRSFFSRFKMVETEFSYSSMYQANLIKEKFVYGSSCTLDMNGKCIIVRWKGTPLQSLSAWKFN